MNENCGKKKNLIPARSRNASLSERRSLRAGAPRNVCIHVSIRPSPRAAARAQETVYERRARARGVSPDSVWSATRKMQIKLILRMHDTRGDIYVTYRRSSGRRCTRMNLPLFPSRITIFIIAHHANERALSDVCLMSRFIRGAVKFLGTMNHLIGRRRINRTAASVTRFGRKKNSDYNKVLRQPELGMTLRDA